MNDVWEGLPGHELVSGGLADLAAGRESEASLVVTMAAARLRSLGIDVPPTAAEGASHRLYGAGASQPLTSIFASSLKLMSCCARYQP
jgi:hypothetical protein